MARHLARRPQPGRGPSLGDLFEHEPTGKVFRVVGTRPLTLAEAPADWNKSAAAVAP